MKGLARCKRQAFVWPHDALHFRERLGWDSPFIHAVPRKLKEPGFSSHVPESVKPVSEEKSAHGSFHKERGNWFD